MTRLRLHRSPSDEARARPREGVLTAARRARDEEGLGVGVPGPRHGARPHPGSRLAPEIGDAIPHREDPGGAECTLWDDPL